MRQLSRMALQQEFVAWQCRIRQIAVRDLGGQPVPAMQPRVSSRRGEVIHPAMTALLVPLEPADPTAFLRFQVQKTPDPQAVREAVIGYLASEFYQLPEEFADCLTAVFAPGSEVAARLVGIKEVVLDFAQYSQGYRMFAKVRRLAARDRAREFSLWQARAFNPNLPNGALVLSFTPDWRSAVATAG